MRITNAATDHRIDVDVEVRVLGEQFQLLIQHLQAFLRNIVRRDVVDGDLQPLQSGAVQAFDTFRDQKIAVRDQACDHAALANAADDLVEFGMQQGLAAADGDDRRSQFRQLVDTLEHEFSGNGFGKIVVLVAVLASQVAAADGNDMRQQRMIR